jgi:hypothetical protein
MPHLAPLARNSCQVCPPLTRMDTAWKHHYCLCSASYDNGMVHLLRCSHWEPSCRREYKDYKHARVFENTGTNAWRMCACGLQCCE